MILPINYDLRLSEPFCDYLNITSPKGNKEALLSDFLPMLDSLGALEASEGLYLLPERAGSFKVGQRSEVCVFSVSGGFLDVLRRNRLYGDYLSVFFNYPHRVSMLHATLDYRIDAPPAIDAIYNLATSGNCFLTRKAISSKNVSRLTGQNLEGVDTGTVYLGSRKNSDVWAKAYDKRQERLAKGFDDCGSMLRIEIAIMSDIGATLRDASNPHDIFFHFAGRSLVQTPPDFKGWVAHGEGYEIEKSRTDYTTWQRLWGMMSNSNDVSRMLDLAIADYGEEDGLIELTKLLRKRYVQRLNGQVT